MQSSYEPAERRNRIIHDPWLIVDAKAAQFRSMPTKDPRFGICEIDKANIEEFLRNAEDLIRRATSLRQEILEALAPPSLNKS
jgi:hypothetical protein